MNLFKKFLFISGCVLGVLFVSGCDDNDDGYSLGKFWVDLATFNRIDRAPFYLTLDDGTTLYPVSPINIGSYDHVANGQRTWVNYTLLSDSAAGYSHYIKINGMRGILTKKVIDLTAQNQDSIGNDPVKINQLWIGDDFLNIGFTYRICSNMVHYINLANNTLIQQTSSDTIALEFRHNANTNLTSDCYSNSGYVAFDLRSYKNKMPGDSLVFKIKTNDFGLEKEYNITYYKHQKFKTGPDKDSFTFSEENNIQ